MSRIMSEVFCSSSKSSATVIPSDIGHSQPKVEDKTFNHISETQEQPGVTSTHTVPTNHNNI